MNSTSLANSPQQDKRSQTEVNDDENIEINLSLDMQIVTSNQNLDRIW